MIFDSDDGTFNYWLDVFRDDNIIFSSKAKLNNKDGMLSITNKRFAFVPSDRKPLVECFAYDDIKKKGKIFVSHFSIDIFLNEIKYVLIVDPVYNWKEIVNCIMNSSPNISFKQFKGLIDKIDKNY